MKTYDLHAMMRRHHLKRFREETDPERRRYHWNLAISIHAHDPAEEPWPIADWHSARDRWLARCRAATNRSR